MIWSSGGLALCVEGVPAFLPLGFGSDCWRDAWSVELTDGHGSCAAHLERQHVLLEEVVGTRSNSPLYAILRATRRAGQLSYTLGQSIILPERLKQALSCSCSFWCRTLLLAARYGEYLADKIMWYGIRKVHNQFLEYRQLVLDFLLQRNESLGS